jgi:hypothetical protein
MNPSLKEEFIDQWTNLKVHVCERIFGIETPGLANSN